MGCHTWCARKVERSIEEGRKLWIEEQEKKIARFKEIANSPQELEDFKWTKELVENTVAIFERQLRMVKAGLCNVAVMRKQPDEGAFLLPRGKRLFRGLQGFTRPV